MRLLSLQRKNAMEMEEEEDSEGITPMALEKMVKSGRKPDSLNVNLIIMIQQWPRTGNI